MTKTRFRKFTAWLLTFVMLMTIVPGFALTASATDSTEGSTPTLGERALSGSGSEETADIELFSHVHEWVYTKTDDTTITATCTATGCPDTDGGSVTIDKPYSLFLGSHPVEADVTNDLIDTSTEVTVVYTDEDSNTLPGAPEAVGNYTASITLGTQTVSVNYDVVKVTSISINEESPAYDAENNTFYVSEQLRLYFEIHGENLSKIHDPQAVLNSREPDRGGRYIGVMCESDTLITGYVDEFKLYLALTIAFPKSAYAQLSFGNVTHPVYLKEAKKYAVDVADTENGNIYTNIISVSGAAAHETVILNVEPDAGYALDTLSAKIKSNGEPLTIKQEGANVYSFIMPAGAVAVEATFKTYVPPAPTPVTTEFEVVKAFNNWSATDSFTFELAAVTAGAPMPADSTAIATEHMPSTYFGPVTYTEEGTYRYIITEVQGNLPGVTYDTAAHEVVVTVTRDADNQLEAAITYDGQSSLIITNVYTEPAVDVSIAAVSIENGMELGGAQLQLLNDIGDVVAEWESGFAAEIIQGLKPNVTYSLRATAAPGGYIVPGHVTFSVDTYGNVTTSGSMKGDTVLIEFAETAVHIMAVKIKNGNALEGAHLQIVDGQDNVYDEWVSDAGAYEATALLTGEAYTLRAVVAPEGHILPGETTFTLDEDGDLITTGMVTADGTLLIAFDETAIGISAVSLDDGEKLEGAHIRILDATSSVVEQWNSDAQVKTINGLKTNVAYTLHITIAPDGYTVPADGQFSIDERGMVNYTGTVGAHNVLLVEFETEIPPEVLWGTDAETLPYRGTWDEFCIAVSDYNTSGNAVAVTYAKLNQDIETDVTACAMKKLTIDLSGHDIISDADIFVCRGGELTIMDTAENDGAVRSASGHCISVEGGTVQIKGGKLTSNGDAAISTSGNTTVIGNAVLSGKDYEVEYQTGLLDLSGWENAEGKRIVAGLSNVYVSDSTIKPPHGYSILDADGIARTEMFLNNIYTIGKVSIYTVTFVDWDDKPLGSDTVEKGKPATAPASPARVGWKFTGWDQAFDNVTGNLTVKARYTEKATVEIDLAQQEYTYDGKPHAFEIKGDVTDGFNITYDGGAVPVNSSLWYGVYISRPEDENYKQFAGTSKIIIHPKSINGNDITITVNEPSYIYDGEIKTPVVTLKDGSTVLTQGEINGTDGDYYTAGIKGSSSVAVCGIEVIGRNNYTDSTDVFFEVLPTFVTELPATAGGKGKIILTAPLGNETVLEYADNTGFANAADFDISGIQEALPGTYYIRVKAQPASGNASYVPASSAVTVAVPQFNAKELNENNISDIEAKTYTGEEIEPVLEVKDGDTTLVLGTDYEVTYQNNVNAGTAKVVVTFKGNYKGNAEKEFTILKKQIDPALALTAPVKNASPQTEIIGDGYTAAVVWSPVVTDKFGYSTEYTATITIVPDNNHTTEGIAAYTVDGAKQVTHEENIVTAAYEKTGAKPSSGGGGGGSATTYTVKFDTNGGSYVANKTVIKNFKLSKPAAPVKEGFTFEDWYTDEELTAVYDFEEKVTKSFTLYAKWQVVPSEDENTSGATGHDCPSVGFDDLDTTQWYHYDTDYVIEKNIFRGTAKTEFEPNGNITRAMMITVLYRTEGEPEVAGNATFEDIDANAYYAKAVIWGQQNGIIKGYSATEYAPEQAILREQIAAIMFRYAQYKGIDVSVGENTNILSYDDFDKISAYAIPAMQWATGSGMIQGRTESTLNPQALATRAEIAAMLHRFMEANK